MHGKPLQIPEGNWVLLHHHAEGFNKDQEFVMVGKHLKLNFYVRPGNGDRPVGTVSGKVRTFRVPILKKNHEVLVCGGPKVPSFNPEACLKEPCPKRHPYAIHS